MGACRTRRAQVAHVGGSIRASAWRGVSIDFSGNVQELDGAMTGELRWFVSVGWDEDWTLRCPMVMVMMMI